MWFRKFQNCFKPTLEISTRLFDCVIGTSGFALSVKTVHSWNMKFSGLSYKEKSRSSLGGVFSLGFLFLSFLLTESFSGIAILISVALLVYTDIVLESRAPTRYRYTGMPRLSESNVNLCHVGCGEPHLLHRAIAGTL